jgi:hypothetical protein
MFILDMFLSNKITDLFRKPLTNTMTFILTISWDIHKNVTRFHRFTISAYKIVYLLCYTIYLRNIVCK